MSFRLQLYTTIPVVLHFVNIFNARSLFTTTKYSILFLNTFFYNLHQCIFSFLFTFIQSVLFALHSINILSACYQATYLYRSVVQLSKWKSVTDINVTALLHSFALNLPYEQVSKLKPWNLLREIN